MLEGLSRRFQQLPPLRLPRPASAPRTKPPFVGSSLFDDISQFTQMRPGPWAAQLDKPPLKGGKSYAELDPAEAARILEGMTRGVDIGYTGARTARLDVANAKSTELEATARLITAIIKRDVAAHFKAGPFDAPPFPDFVVSLLGAVPKPNSADGVRLIHNLSHPFHGDSVNSRIAKEDYLLSRFDDACEAI